MVLTLYSNFDTIFEQTSKKGYRKDIELSNKGYTKVIESKT